MSVISLKKAARNIMALFDNSMVISYKIWLLDLPAAGNCNGGSVNNVGNNGNVWASSLNSSNVSNAWNFNFNSGGGGVNNNNRYYGYSVRAVVGQHSAPLFLILSVGNILQIFFMTLDKTQLYFDLYEAFICAKKHKSKKQYVINFEKNLKENLLELTDELIEKRYKPRPSVCFIVEKPKKREIFAANFRDRIVHHLYYNYTYDLFNNTFIEDSYSCRKGKGTHYGIHRLEKHIRQESENYTKDAYVLKMDIKGYFIHINRLILLKIVNNCLDKMRKHCLKEENLTWEEKIDYDFVKYLSEVIILNDPTKNCIIRGSKKNWIGLPDSKTLFKTPKNCGLPIGNLTSQLFSNIYLNVFDQYMKRELGCKHYGRYVDDFYVVSKGKNFLKEIVKEITVFMKEKLNLDIQEKKTHIINVKQGVDFLGAFIKPYRTYLSNKCIKRIKREMYNLHYHEVKKDVVNMVNSYLGLFSHWKSNKIKKELFSKIGKLNNYGHFKDKGYRKFVQN